MNETNFALYYAALKADTRFHTELVRVYGERNAGDARYNRVHTDDGVNAARDAYREAAQAWREEMRRSRADSNAYKLEG